MRNEYGIFERIQRIQFDKIEGMFGKLWGFVCCLLVVNFEYLASLHKRHCQREDSLLFYSSAKLLVVKVFC